MFFREGKKCVIYIRVSTAMQIDGFSLDAQRNTLKRFAEREGMIIVEVYEDAGKSGKSIEGRPAFKKMLSDIENGLEIDYVLVFKLSRFGRNAADVLSSLEFIQSYDINLICAEEGIDSSQASGRLLISVLSSVAEIERENIIEQTTSGRQEKARQGKWNGGFAPYGYSLERVGNSEKKQLVIAEDEAEVIKIIYDKYVNTNVGVIGVAKYLNLQGIKKKVRQNGKLDTWSTSLVKSILDNPVYCGKIAYGRRTTEKVKGSKETKQVRKKNEEDYILVDGEHEAIIDIETWEKAKAKRKLTGIKPESTVGRDRIHLLTGILKCPVCGAGMYTNRNTWTSKSTGYHEAYYYVCKNVRIETGHKCEYKKQIKKEKLEYEVISAIKEMVNNPVFVDEIKNKIGMKIDTNELDREIYNYTTKYKEVEASKKRLEISIDSLSPDVKFYDKKLQDMNDRLNGLYDTMYELEEKIRDAELKKQSVEMEALTVENIYMILQNFDNLYDKLTDDEKQSVVTALIKEIQIFEKDTAPQNLKSITFNFPVFVDGKEVNEILWENENTVETCLLLSHKNISTNIELEVDFSNIKVGEEKATYKDIQNYIKEKHGLHVHTSYIGQVKRMNGLEVGDYKRLPDDELKNKRKNVPEDKIRAIEDALMHFGIMSNKK